MALTSEESPARTFLRSYCLQPPVPRREPAKASAYERICGVKEPSWVIGSYEEFTADVAAICDHAARRFGVELADGYAVLFASTTVPDADAMLGLETSNVVARGSSVHIPDLSRARMSEKLHG